MNETCDRCGPAVRAAYRASRGARLDLCGHCANQLRLRRDIMHPMFKQLFLGTDDLAAEDDRRRRVRRPRQTRPAKVIRPAAGNRENRPRP